MLALVTPYAILIALACGTVVKKWHKSTDGGLYFIQDEQKYNWFEAWNECIRKNMSLLTIDTYERHAQIDPLIRSLFPRASCPPFWLAAHDNAVEHRHEWATTAEVFTFTNWDGGQPSHLANEHCILIWTTWQWHDTFCSSKFGFICEENRFLERNRETHDHAAESKGMAKTFIWRNYNVRCGQNFS